MEKNESINELLTLKRDYELERLELSDKREILKQKKREIYDQIIETIKDEIDLSSNSERLQSYLERTYIREIGFLDRSLHYIAGNNLRGDLSFYKLLLLNRKAEQLALGYGISSENELGKVFYNYNYRSISHPFLEDERVLEIIKKISTLAYLDEVFKDINNILDYQGTYTVFRYIKNYLKEVLKDGSSQTDDELVYKDYNQKVEYVLENLTNIASYLLTVRDQIPNSRLALCNHGLSRTAKKLPGTNISYDQKVFTKGIAFGTTLENLQEGNYESAKELIFIPHQQILK